MRPLRIRAEYRLDTPLFLGGPDGDAPAVLRTPPWKGAIRFWMRALVAPSPTREDPWQREERAWCGNHPVEDARNAQARDGAKDPTGRSPWTLRVGPAPDLRPSYAFDAGRYQPLRATLPAGNGRPASWINGVPYCWFPLTLKGNSNRTAFPAGARIPLEIVVVHPEPGTRRLGLGERGRRALLGSLWLLGHLGSLGMRASRGAGSVSLAKWSVEAWGGGDAGDWAADCDALPLAGAARSAEEWAATTSRGLAVLREWFPLPESVSPAVPCLDRRARIILVPDTRHRDLPPARNTRGFQPWELALDGAGSRLQLWRRRDRESRDAVLGQLLEDSGHPDGAPLADAPPRVQFGLPLAFRFAQRPARYRNALRVTDLDLRSAAGTQERFDRFASPLRVRVVDTGAACRAVLVRMGGVLPGDANGGALAAVQAKTKRSQRGGLHARRQADLLDRFVAEVAGEPGAIRVGEAR